MASKTTRYSCPCGTVEVSIAGAPLVACNCHCSACRDLTACPVWQGAPCRPEQVSITKGAGSVEDRPRPDALKFVSRVCGDCGHRVYHLNKGGLAVIPVHEVRRASGGVLPPEWEPSCHIFYSERVLDAPEDGLPAYAARPGDGAVRLARDGTPLR